MFLSDGESLLRDPWLDNPRARCVEVGGWTSHLALGQTNHKLEGAESTKPPLERGFVMHLLIGAMTKLLWVMVQLG